MSKDLQIFCRCKVSRFTYNNKDSQIIKELRSRFGEFEYEVYNDKVTYLGLKSKKVKNEDLELIRKLVNLQELCFNNNQITKIQDLNNLVELEYLHLNDNQISKIQGLDKLTDLRHLYLVNNQITTIQGLEKLTELRELNLAHNQITKIEGLEKLDSLKHLWLNNNQITTIQGLDKLTRDLSYLQEISLEENNIPKEEIKQFKTNNPEISIYY